MKVFGDTNVMCGDIIEVLIPMNRSLSSGDVDTFPDPILSGRYLITSLAHQVNHPTQQHVMVLTAMKDSVSSAVPTKTDIKYPQERVAPNDMGLSQKKKQLRKRSARIFPGL